MNKRAILAALALTLCGWRLRASDTSYTVKVVSVNRNEGRVEARFVVLPEDLRLVCVGKVDNVFETDYVKVEYKNKEVYIKGAKCVSMLWVH